MRPRDPIKPSEPNPGDAALSNAVGSASSDNSASAMFSGHLESSSHLESSGPLESAGFAEPSAASTGHLESPASSESANESFGSGSTVLKSRLPIFSALVLIAITTLAMVAYSYSARKINEAYVERQLLFASQTLKMLLYSLVDGELALMLKLADTDVTRDYLRSPFDAKLEKAAREKFEGFNRFLRNGALFWSSAVDRRLFSMTDPTRQIPFGEPDSEWYDFTMKSGQPFFITVGPNIFTGRDTVWLNVPVLDADSEKRPLGLLGSGIELDLWLREAELAFQCLDPQLNWYLFGSDGRIITAANAGFGGLKASIFEELGDIKTELGHAAEGVRPRGPFLKDRNLYQITYIENFNWLLVVKYTLPDLIALNLPFNIMFFSMFLIFFFIIFSFNIFIRKADIELAEGRQSLLLANRKAEKASRAKSMMLAIVSHELRTPLNAIIGVSRLILREDTSKTVRESVLSVKQAGDSAMALITDLLDLSRIEAGHFEVATKPYWLGSLVQDVINIIRLRLSDTNLSLVVKIEPTLPARLSGDEIRLRRVLLNLMSNAVKYTQEGHVSLSIRRGDDPLDLAGNPSFAPEETTLASSNETASPSPKETVSPSPPDVSKTADESKEAPIETLSSQKIQTNQKAMALQNDQTCAEGQTIRLVLEVADSGVGIKEKDLAQLFDSFIRLDREINQDIEGSGLGLAIAKSLTETMNGEIAVSSIYGVGSVFTVTVPQVVVSPAPVGEAPIPEISSDLGDLSVHFVAPEAKILIVDDIRTNLKVGRGLLAPYEAAIDLCEHAREAPGLVEKGGYDLVFLDHMMPFMTGVEVAAKIRAMEGPAGKTPLIALTGDAAPEMAKMFLEKGFDDVLAKPVDLARLGDVMDRWIPMPLRREPSSRGRLSGGHFAGDIPDGLNARIGLSHCGGQPGYYIEVLACFRRDALERMKILSSEPAFSNLPLIAGQLHALKTAAGGVGAALLASKAGALEAAAKKGDLSLIQKDLPGFNAKLSKLLTELSSFIAVNASAMADPDASLDPETLKSLIEALEAEDIKKIDDLLEAMPRALEDSSMGAFLTDVNEAVLRLELAKAADLARKYLADHFSE